MGARGGAAERRRVSELGAIHAGKKALELSDDDYRTWLLELTFKESAKDLNAEERARVLDAMRTAGFQRKPGAKTERYEQLAAAKADPNDARGTAPQLVVITGLWQECHELGVVRDPSDTALLAFVARMSRGIRRLEWLTGDAAIPIIEALKAMRDRGNTIEGGGYRAGKTQRLTESLDPKGSR